jgi:hypothetical protein
MNTSKLSKNIYMRLSILPLLLLGLVGCAISEMIIVGPKTTGVGVEDSYVKEPGGVDLDSTSAGYESTPGPETRTYSNEIYGFQFEYPDTWKIVDVYRGIALVKGNNRLTIQFDWLDEVTGRHFGRTGIPAGDLIYEGKIRFMDQIVFADVLIYEKKYKGVFYGGTSQIEIDNLAFVITLEDQESDYLAVDLTDEIINEAQSILETFKWIDRVSDSPQGAKGTESGLTAYLQIPERIPTGEKINLKFILANESDISLYVLNWYTPLEGIGGEIFRVTHAEQPLPYEGILASRMPPSSEGYVLLNPGESASAVVDLAQVFDFSKPGIYRIEFISPSISHVALSEAEMASTMEALEPINISSKAVFVELFEGSSGEGLPQIYTPEEAEDLIVAYLRSQGLDLGVEPILPVEEVPLEELWGALGVQVFRVSAGKFMKESFLVRGSDVIQLGAALGGQGLTSLLLSDLDQDGQVELLYAYSSGSDDSESRIGMYAPAYDENTPLETDVSYFGYWRVYSGDGSHVGVQVVEVDRDTKTLRYLDTVGHLAIEVHNGIVKLILHAHPDLPDEVQRRIINH